MQKTLVIVLLVFSISVSAKVTLTAEEREVIDSLVATYDQLLPVAALPKEWPPNVDLFLSAWDTRDNVDILNWLSKKIIGEIDGTVSYPNKHFQKDTAPEPTQPGLTDYVTEISYANLDSGNFYIRWDQNINDPLPRKQLDDAFKLATDERCLILDLRRFYCMNIDSVMQLLAYFTADTSASFNIVTRRIGTREDSIVRHTLPKTTAQVWDKPLVVVFARNGLPTRVIEEGLKDRPFTLAKDIAPAFGLEYTKVSLGHGYRTLVATTIVTDKNDKIVGDRKWKIPGLICGTIDPEENKKSREFTFYQEFKNYACNAREQYRGQASFAKKLGWQVEDLYDALVPQDEPERIVIH